MSGRTAARVFVRSIWASAAILEVLSMDGQRAQNAGSLLPWATRSYASTLIHAVSMRSNKKALQPQTSDYWTGDWRGGNADIIACHLCEITHLENLTGPKNCFYFGAKTGTI